MIHGNIDMRTLVKNYVHAGKQFPEHNLCAVITVGRIGEFSDPGSLDFGGSEYSEAEVQWRAPVKRKRDDKFGWWHLTAGRYMVEFNESLEVPPGIRFYFQTWEKAKRCGVSVPLTLIDSPKTPLWSVLTVSSPGIDIKENARLAQVGIFT